MDYTISKITANGYEVQLCASGKWCYIVLTKEEGGEYFISRIYEREEGERLFWKLGKLVTDNMHGWCRWVEMLEA